MNIGIMTLVPATDRKSWSGTYYFMRQALLEQGATVVEIGPFKTRLDSFGAIINKVCLLFFRKKYDFKRSRWYSAWLGRKATKKASAHDLDFIVAPAASVLIAHFHKAQCPIVFVSDTTFQLISEYYRDFTDLLGLSMRDGNRQALMAMQKSDLVTFPSEWAASSARNYYGIEPKKVSVIPFGANMAGLPGPDIVESRTKSGQCNILFVGVDWQRKGGNIVYETLLSLEADQNIKANLIICGCDLPQGLEHERIKTLGFLDKNNPAQAKMLAEIYMEADYLFVPTRSECYGVVFCEASAFALPSISTDTGGVGGVITEGVNGHLLPLNANGQDYAALIAKYERDDNSYKEICRSSRDLYDQKLNWGAWAKTILSEMATNHGVR